MWRPGEGCGRVGVANGGGGSGGWGQWGWGQQWEKEDNGKNKGFPRGSIQRKGAEAPPLPFPHPHLPTAPRVPWPLGGG